MAIGALITQRPGDTIGEFLVPQPSLLQFVPLLAVGCSQGIIELLDRPAVS